MPKKTVIFDQLDGFLGQALANSWREKGGCAVDASACGGLSTALANSGLVCGVVLTESTLDEAALVERAESDPEAAAALADAIHRQTLTFLGNCQTATLSMMHAKNGQVLALGIDDVSARFLGLPQTPIANHSRAATLMSLAKEYGRMGIRYNTVVYQPSRNMVDESVWRTNRDRLKVYTLRYKPFETADYLRFLLSMLKGNTPANGSLICLGNGVVEMAA